MSLTSAGRRSPSILVVGAGVAGAACAIGLRRRGIDVTLVEQKSFPRHKVCGCCIGGAGVAELETLGALENLQPKLAHTQRWIGWLDGRRIELPIGDGIAISRADLDTTLVEMADRLGAEVLLQCKAVITTDATSTNGTNDHRPVEVKLVSPAFASSAKTGTATDESLHTLHRTFDGVVIAAGLKFGDVGGRFPWIEKPNGPFGVSFLGTCANIEPGVIYMVCDDDGYVGAVRLANGDVDVAAAFRSGASATSGGSPIQRVNAMMERNRVGFEFTPTGELMTTPPLRRTRRCGYGRIVAIGDAAGYVEPFTGEGMTWALQAAREVSDCIETHASQLERVGEIWSQRSRSLLATKKRTCRAITTGLRSQIARRAAATALSRFPGLASPLVAHLARPSTPLTSPTTG